MDMGDGDLMAKMTVKVGDEYAKKLGELAAAFQGETAAKAVYAGAGAVADAIRQGIQSLPEQKFRYLRPGEQFTGVTSDQKADLLEALGVSPIKADADGTVNAKIGFDGYGRHRTKAYPQGLPNALLARSIESGSSVRRKKPFVRPAVKSAKSAAEEAMARVIEDEIRRIMGE
jgi:hypothetical protein